MEKKAPTRIYFAIKIYFIRKISVGRYVGYRGLLVSKSMELLKSTGSWKFAYVITLNSTKEKC